MKISAQRRVVTPPNSTLYTIVGPTTPIDGHHHLTSLAAHAAPLLPAPKLTPVCEPCVGVRCEARIRSKDTDMWKNQPVFTMNINTGELLCKNGNSTHASARSSLSLAHLRWARAQHCRRWRSSHPRRVFCVAHERGSVHSRWVTDGGSAIALNLPGTIPRTDRFTFHHNPQ